MPRLSKSLTRRAVGNFDYVYRDTGLWSWECLVCDTTPMQKHKRRGLKPLEFGDYRAMEQSAVQHAGTIGHLRNCLEYEAAR